MIAVNKASRHGVEALSKKLLKLLEDKSSQLYQDNVAKFGIPEELVKKAFSEETLLEAVDSGRAVFYLALENKCKILGFAQMVSVDSETAELDRIVVFPENTRKGLGTKLLTRALGDLEKKGLRRVVVKAGKDEKHARQFYEKNGFTFVKEETLEAPWGKIELAVYQRSLKQHS